MAADKDKDKKRRDATDGSGSEDTPEPVVRDKRRIDPKTGERRDDVDQGEETLTDEDLAKLLEEPPADDSSSEHLNDLKRVQAEYANYRKRVDRDRYVARELAIAELMTGLLPVLDDLDLAHAHGDLEGSPLEIVGQKLRAGFERYGLVKLGAVGEPFDPKLHEAIAQLPSKDVTVDTIADVVQPGYQLGERLLRPAKVAVAVPEA
ncbi:molecular chaperone GrpE [Cryobacterium mesophilum]|uniref:Protein GrpE n=1 Tax=Terrimesophilobacter mesophilus TaxID=433647 RepID=A0A4R8V9F8_9MICO|nr:nucleotide exchange factor GrpE [Terrimesophilobacter mesophilus]MBB5633048.1 molecular chaperone GrpE [Terrimesophilobacter mesophilus]TFB79811.1 nucleotide exchange factor GrpE [Terrimesophilobacter mesophilus]